MEKLDYGEILKAYQLQVDQIEEHSRNVLKIHTKQGQYALKSISKNQDLRFIYHIGELYSQGYTRVIPIFKTINGQFVVERANKFYYLMPWLNNESSLERSERYQQMFRQVARLHTVTRKELNFDEEDVKQYYTGLKEKWENRNKFLEGYVDRCENQLYMSPFELQFASYFTEMMQACQFARARLDEWYGLMKEVKSFRTAFTHGKISIKHFLYDSNNKGYLLSPEKLKHASPVNDLVSFYYRTLRTYPVQSDECFEWYNYYNEHFPLRDEEIQLLLTYLTYPEPMYRVVDSYVNGKTKGSEQESVKQLTKAYWLNKNIEYLASHMMQQEHQKKEQKLAEEFEEELDPKD